MTLTMGMDAKKVELLLRTALLDDATNMNERLAALLAEISVHDDESAWITLDMDLWPEDKVSPAVEEIAKMLWLEIEWETTEGTSPFAWPGIGDHAGSTTEYLRLVLGAYGAQKPKG